MSLLLILVDSRFSEIGIKIKSKRVNARALTVVAVADGASDAAPVADRPIEQLVFERTRVIEVSRRARADGTFVPA